MADTIPGNISSTQTLQIGSSAGSAIDFAGDTDWWRVTLSTGFQYQVWVEGLSSGNGTLFDPYLAVYNSAGVFQLSNNDAGSLTRDAFLTVLPTTGGTFFLSAESFGNNATGSYTLTIWRDELASTATAATVNVNGWVDGRVGWQSDTSDWYAVSLTAGVTYVVDLIGSGNDGAARGLTLADPYLFLRDSSGTIMLGDDNNGLGQNARLFFTPQQTGTYYLDAQESGVNASGIYRLIVNSNPIFGQLAIGSAQAASVDFAGDTDFHRVWLTAGVPYVFSVDGGTLLDPTMELLDVNGATVASDDNSGVGSNATLTYTPSSTGTFYVAARASGYAATGTYTVRATEVPTVSIADATVVEGDVGTTDLVFTLTLSAPSSVPVSVLASTSGIDTATAGIDFLGGSATVSFAPGQTTATFTVRVAGDTSFEPTEVFHVNLSSPVGARLGDAAANGFISDNDNPYALPSDPYARLEWYLYPRIGINAFPVWADYTGAGVRVAVFDQGIDPSHPDLDGNLLVSLGRRASNLSSGGAPVLSGDNHGTAVAGTIAAERDGSGVVGVAYGASLVSIYSPLLLDSTLPAQIANAYTYAAAFDVLNDSWGFANGFSSGITWAFYDNFSLPTFAAAGNALAALAATGRNGLGTVVVQSAGNSYSVGDDTNLHNFQNSQYIITVAATDYRGNVTSYSSAGASVLVAAPGGVGGSGGTENDDYSGIMTTDRVGGVGYTSGSVASVTGTSFSSPIVAGVVALMLDANPALGYRDVQEILAYSAIEISPAGNDWRYNGASNWNGGGLHYDALEHNLGFGLVDARAAVRLAETWGGTAHTAANRVQLTQTHTPRLAIPDNSRLSGAYDSFNIGQSIDVERVEVTLNVTHSYIGDLSVLLTSPSGVTSFLVYRPQQSALSAFGSSRDNINFTFDTVLDWGENSAGTWLIGIYDNAAGDIGTFDSWTLNIIGKPASADDTYIYTDEFAESVADQGFRATLNDSGGIDTLNAAALSTPVVLNLNPGATSTIDGRSLFMGATTMIEKAYGGDGGDLITGNASANTLYGMRGNDTLVGGAGDDLLCGGAGNDTLDGGGGIDIALYAGLRSAYTVSYSPATLSYTVRSIAEGLDTLTGIERLRFADGEFAITSLGSYHGSAGGDFNGDGRADILWRNDSGYVAMWQMNGLAISQGGGVGTLPGNWTVADCAGDYNGDGKSDILWRNDSGYVAIWQMNGMNILSGSGVASLPADWHIEDGAGDYNGDGKSDLLWRNDSGYVAVWLMDGVNIIGGGGVASLPNDWHIESGAGDYNGDGKSDILWRKDSGYVAAWLMNGVNIATGSGIASLPNDWHIEDGAGDYNGDGKSDILWRNDSGYVALWQMNGVGIVGSGGIGTLPGDWQVMPLG